MHLVEAILSFMSEESYSFLVDEYLRWIEYSMIVTFIWTVKPYAIYSSNKFKMQLLFKKQNYVGI